QCTCTIFSFLTLPIHSLIFLTPPAPTDISTLSLHDALPISNSPTGVVATRDFYRRVIDFAHTNRIVVVQDAAHVLLSYDGPPLRDRKSTRLNSSHRTISYAVFCLKKKKKSKKKQKICTT